MNPSGSSQLDLLEFPEEWNLQQKETSTDYLRDADNPKREQLVRVPTDGSTFIWNAPFKPLSVDIINSTGQSVNITDDTGDKIQIAGGSFVSMPVNGALHYTFQLASADSTGRACFCIFYRYRRNVAGASAAGGAATSVTIAGPLDGSGNVKTALEAALPAGTNLIGHVDVDNFPATQPVSGNVGITGALPAGSNLLGLIVAQGNIGDLQQDPSGDLYTTDRATANWNTTQTALSITAASVAVARPTRTRIEIRNLDAAINVWIGQVGLTTANGMLLKPGESRAFYAQTAIYAIAASGTPSIEIADYFA